MNNIKSSFIRKRGNNFNVYIEYIDENGDLKQKSLAKYESKKDADKHLVEIKSSINKNNFIVAKDITFTDRYKEYIYDPDKKFSPTTLSLREVILRKNIEPFFKDTKLKDVTPSLLQKYANYIYRDYTKTSSISRLAVVKSVLNEAYRLKEIHENPCDYIKPPKTDVKATARIPCEPYNIEEIKFIIEKIEGESIEIPILLMLTCGLRYGEMAGLRWQDVDFANNTISVKQVLIYDKGQILFKGPKTQGSLRTISAPDELMLKLKKWKIEHNKYKLEGVLEYEELVCLNTRLMPILDCALITKFKRFLKKINVREVRLHDLRHTHATMLVLSGTDFKTISNRLGHTDIKITLNRYSHVLEEMDKKASKNISNIMFR